MNYRRIGVRYVATLAATLPAFLAVACGGGDPGREPTPAAHDTTDEPPGFPSIPEPPRAFASADSGNVELGIGSYCWPGSGSGAPGACVDRPGVVTAATPLYVGAGGAISVAHPAPGTPIDEIVIRARLAPAGSEPLESGELLWPPGAGSMVLAPSRRDDAILFVAPRDPGTWLVELFLRFGGGGDVTYGLLLQVR